MPLAGPKMAKPHPCKMMPGGWSLPHLISVVGLEHGGGLLPMGEGGQGGALAQCGAGILSTHLLLTAALRVAGGLGRAGLWTFGRRRRVRPVWPALRRRVSGTGTSLCGVRPSLETCVSW